MDVEVDDLGYIEKIDAAVDDAYRGLLPEYHKTLGERLVHMVGIWIDKDCLEDVLCDIKYCRGTVDALIEEDAQRNRHGDRRIG